MNTTSDHLLYMISLAPAAGHPDIIEVFSPGLKFTNWGAALNGTWTELTTDGEDETFHTGRCLIPWARILDIRTPADMDDTNDTNGLDE